MLIYTIKTYFLIPLFNLSWHWTGPHFCEAQGAMRKLPKAQGTGSLDGGLIFAKTEGLLTLLLGLKEYGVILAARSTADGYD